MNSPKPDGELLWSPSAQRVAAARMTQFRLWLSQRCDLDLPDSAALHGFSIDRQGEFWSAVWDFGGVVGDKGERSFVDNADMRAARYFPDASLNVVDTMLARSDEAPALILANEVGDRDTMSWRALRDEVSAAAHALLRDGVVAGDVVAAWLPNIAQAFVTALAAATIGAIYTSTSPDFGTAGVVDRFGQVGPKILIAADAYRYAGRVHDCMERLREICAALPTLKRVVVVGHVDPVPDLSGLPFATAWSDFAAPTDEPLPVRRLPFDAPLSVLYSSGTTGPPKCLIHRAGGILLTHLKEHQLHCDVRPDDRVFYYTTTGWMMWNWLLSALASQATLVVYDGSPVFPAADSLFDLVDDRGITLFGTSAKFLDTARKEQLVPARHHEFSTLRTITSTGSPLSPETFGYVYDAVRADVHLASISGGTDICGCFVMGDPTRPVYAGEIQGPALGMAVDVYDTDGRPAPIGVTGELVCTRPFPSMPLGLWRDVDGRRFNSAYFTEFAGVWRHGDWLSRTGHGGFVISGRSDATLNPGGVRIGTAEIYRAVDRLPQVVDSVAIGQRIADDVRIVLFVRLADGVELTRELEQEIRAAIRVNCSPRHVPAVIAGVTDVPRTRSGKLVELAVRNVVEGRPVRNLDAIANPESLEQFRDRPELS